MAIAAAPEVPHEERGHEELHQRPAQGADELPEDSEQRVPDLVDREIEVVEPTVVVGVEHERRAVNREHGAQSLPGASLAGGAHFLRSATAWPPRRRRRTCRRHHNRRASVCPGEPGLPRRRRWVLARLSPRPPRARTPAYPYGRAP